MNEKKLQPEPSFFAVIPTAIMKDRTISMSARMLFASLISLTRQKGYCYASNPYLGEQIGVSPVTIKNLLTELENRNLIKREVSKTTCGTKRKMFILLDYSQWGRCGEQPSAVKDPYSSTTVSNQTGGSLNSDGAIIGISNKEENNIYDFRELKSFFISCYKEKKLVDYAFAGGKDGNAIKRFLAMQDRPDWKKLIVFFFNHKKSEEYPTISACLSTDTINQFRLHHRPSLKEQFDQLK